MIISFTENVATPTNFPNCCQNIFCFQSLCSEMVTKCAARRKYSHESWYLNQQLNRPSVASHFVLRQSVYNEFITPFFPKVPVTLTEKTVSLSNMHVHLKIKHSGVPFKYFASCMHEIIGIKPEFDYRYVIKFPFFLKGTSLYLIDILVKRKH